jgi:alkaline phosphatase D
MNLSKPTVGPIVGHTTSRQTRLFLRGEAEREGSGFRRCFGVVKWKPVGGKSWSAPLFNKLSPNFHMTGVLVLDALTPDTLYEYKAGWFFADAELETVQELTDRQIEWPEASAHFRTGTDDVSAARSYVVGSCRYLLRLFGGTFFDDRGDKAFRSVLRQINDQSMSVSALLMIGDQIYADDLSIISPDTRVDQFLERYRTVFSQEHVRELMSQVPTYMILDDHEIENNWPSEAKPGDYETLYPHAIHAYQVYQCSHGPLFETTKDGRLDGTLTHFWYRFSDGCAEWFVMDTRTERKLSTAGNQLISEVQMKALLSWLSDGSGKVKLVVSSVPVFPDLSSDSDDKWSAFPEQRTQVLEHIRVNKIRKVVFVSGDLHCSFVSHLRVDSDPDFSVHAVVSSSFFWPYPHTDESDLLFGKALRSSGNTRYVSKKIAGVFSADNFARIDVDPQEVRISFFERKGARLGKIVKLAL